MSPPGIWKCLHWRQTNSRQLAADMKAKWPTWRQNNWHEGILITPNQFCLCVGQSVYRSVSQSFGQSVVLSVGLSVKGPTGKWPNWLTLPTDQQTDRPTASTKAKWCIKAFSSLPNQFFPHVGQTFCLHVGCRSVSRLADGLPSFKAFLSCPNPP